MDKKTRSILTAGSVGIVALLYFGILSAKSWTWTFVSGDSGDWLAASQMWFVPQPYGSPLYILLGHLVNLLPGSLVVNMTILLSCLPAAITVSFTYLITEKITGKVPLALISSIILMSFGIFMSQSTILEEYVLATMFLTIGFWCYVTDRKMLTFVFLGLGTAVHVIVAFVSAFWLVFILREHKAWWKPLLVYLSIGVMPYLMVPILMSLDVPQLLAGKLSLGGLNAYLGETGTVGSLSIVETPRRLFEMAVMLCLNFGLSFVALYYGLKKPWDTKVKLIIVTLGVCLWLYLTNMTGGVWTFLTFALPITAVAVAVGLSKLSITHTKIVVTGALILLVVNMVFLNANTLTKDSNAQSYYSAIQSLPEGSAVITDRGGNYAFGLFRAIAEGKDVKLLYLTATKSFRNQGYLDYLDWASKEWDITGRNVLEQAQDCLNKGYGVYFVTPMMRDELKGTFTFSEEEEYFSKVEAVSGEQYWIREQ